MITSLIVWISASWYAERGQRHRVSGIYATPPLCTHRSLACAPLRVRGGRARADGVRLGTELLHVGVECSYVLADVESARAGVVVSISRGDHKEGRDAGGALTSRELRCNTLGAKLASERRDGWSTRKLTFSYHQLERDEDDSAW